MDEFFPGWKKNVLRLQDTGNVTEQALDHILDTAGKSDHLKIKPLRSMERELVSALIKRFVERAAGVVLTKGQLKELAESVGWQVGSRMSLSEDFECVRDREALTIRRTKTEDVSRVIEKDQAQKGVQISQHLFELTSDLSEDRELFMDADTLRWPLELRHWREGDEFIPLGMEGTQKVSDHLTNRKVQASKKENALILSGADGTIYAIIFSGHAASGESGSVSEKVKVTSGTEQYFTITTSRKE